MKYPRKNFETIISSKKSSASEVTTAAASATVKDAAIFRGKVM